MKHLAPEVEAEEKGSWAHRTRKASAAKERMMGYITGEAGDQPLPYFQS